MAKTDTPAEVTGEHASALALFRAGEYRKASRALEELLSSESTSAVWNDWATAKLMCGETAESERGYRCALELDPENSRAAGNLGALLARNGRVPDALPLFEKAAETSFGEEREQLLRLIQAYRRQLAASAIAPASGANVLEKMAHAIHQQSVAIASLAKRMSALEAAALGNGNSTASHPRENNPPPALESAAINIKRSSSQAIPKPGVLFRGTIYGASGYAEESWSAAVALAENQIPLQLAPTGEKKDTGGLIPAEARRRLEALTEQQVNIPESILYQANPAHSWDMNLFGRVRIGRTMYETDSIPDSFTERCNTMDEVWVPSHFNLETFAAGGVLPQKLRCVPGGIDTHVFKPGSEPLKVPKRRGFNFISVFDWQDRKGYDILLRAYLREFTADDDVALLLKVYQIVDRANDLTAFITDFVERRCRLKMERAPVIVLINGFLNQQDMVRFYAAGQCFVLPTHGEGYGRPFLEAMACELPVIATDWGGQMDFLTPQNSYLIESKLVNVPADVEVNVSSGHRWAQPDEDHLRALMREIYSHTGEARQKAMLGRERVQQEFDWSVVAPLWVKEFRRLLN